MIDHLQQRFDGSFPLHEALTTITAVNIGKRATLVSSMGKLNREQDQCSSASRPIKEKRQHITSSQGLLVITIKPENSLSNRNFDAAKFRVLGVQPARNIARNFMS
jgi:hypothetical protein